MKWVPIPKHLVASPSLWLPGPFLFRRGSDTRIIPDFVWFDGQNDPGGQGPPGFSHFFSCRAPFCSQTKENISGREMETQLVVERLTEAVEVLRQVETNLRTSSDEVWHTRRPDGRKVRVLIRASIISLGEIDTVKQEFSADVWLAAWYKEPLLKGKKHREEVDWDDQWHPRIVLFNAVSVDKHEKKHHLILEEGDDVPIVQQSNRIKATFKEPMELFDFPFDHQELTIQLMSDWPTSQVEFAKNMGIKDTIRTDTFTGSHEWELYGHLLCKPAITGQHQSTSHQRYALYNITAHVQRKMGFYVWNIAFIMFLIMALSFTAFSVPPNEPADRLSVTLTLLLTSVAFKFVVTQSLPTISYLTLLDKYVLLCMIFQCLMAVQNALASIMSNAWLFDVISMGVLAGVVFFTHLVFGVLMFIKIRGTNKQLGQADKEYLNLCENIDRFYKRTKCTISGFTDEEVEAIVGQTELAGVENSKQMGIDETKTDTQLTNLPGSVQDMQPSRTNKYHV
ncbi:glycine receptor subunit alpha-4-like isoform X1 [Branchiostoma lanceolatum]|uniref:glycine receptor subunit alpha-4-like isoform X1 n=2 Tax=Branchiostoma lanceolatum TaxID=7740 RepID=UPI00345478B9